MPDRYRKRPGRVTIRAISFHNDKTIDQYVVSGGSYKTCVVGSKFHAERIANSRRRVIKKRKARKAGYGLSYMEKARGGSRRKYYGILKQPISAWPSKAQAKRSHAYSRLLKAGQRPRVRKW